MDQFPEMLGLTMTTFTCPGEERPSAAQFWKAAGSFPAFSIRAAGAKAIYHHHTDRLPSSLPADPLTRVQLFVSIHAYTNLIGSTIVPDTYSNCFIRSQSLTDITNDVRRTKGRLRKSPANASSRDQPSIHLVESRYTSNPL